jgi:hypothetical protein
MFAPYERSPGVEGVRLGIAGTNQDAISYQDDALLFPTARIFE